jgi:hypothetical protein
MVGEGVVLMVGEGVVLMVGEGVVEHSLKCCFDVLAFLGNHCQK